VTPIPTEITPAPTHFPGPRPTGLTPAALVALYLAIGLLPLAIAALGPGPGRGFWHELSSGLVMVAFAITLAQFLLSGRFRPISGKVGIDLTMRFHQLAAWALLAFVLLHPILYAVPTFAADPAAGFARLRGMFASPGLRTGVIAWWLLVALVLMGARRDRLRMRYETWRLSHGLGAALVAGLAAHHTLAVGTYAARPVLAGFWIALTAVALLSLVHVYLLKPLLQRRNPWRVTANEPAADRMWRVAVEPESGRAPDFAAGQFAWANLGHSPFSLTEHPFSISSAPADRARIEFTIKEAGDFTARVGTIPPGTPAYLDGPHGTFTPAGRPACRLVLIGGGVGFAPLLGILRQLAHENWPHPVDVIYGNRAQSQIVARDELEALEARLDLRLHLVLSEPPPDWPGPRGELTPDILAACLPERDRDALYLVCGPVPMMNAVERALLDLGIPADRIVSERFTYE
jgi:predicted ferric reductase